MRRLATLVASALLLVTGCGSGGAATRGAAPDDPPVTGTLTVFAAASLTGPFTRIGRDVEAAHPGLRVSFNFGGSSGLANQINQGAPADVFASAAPAPVRAVADAGNLDGTPTVFAANQLVVAVPEGNPGGVRGLADLARPRVKVALCAEQVPCGDAARRALTAARVRLTPVTLERDVKAALSKVRLGEVDAALVYRTDVRDAAAEVDGVEFAESAETVNEYPVAVLKDAPNPGAARAFVDHVRSAAGRAVLTEAGFRVP